MMRTYEAGIGILIMLVALIQFVILSAGRVGEQWDSTQLDVEVKKALQEFQTGGVSGILMRYSKIRDPDLLRLPQSEGIGYRVLINGEPVGRQLPLSGVEVAAADARIHYLSRDSARLARCLRSRLLRDAYVQEAGHAMDYDSVDELADLIMSLMLDPESRDIMVARLQTLIDNQNDDGGWGFVRGEESDVLCTSMAIRALSIWIKANGGSPLSNSTVTRGIDWVKGKVHADGGYGSKEWIESSVEMTAYALLAFTEVGLTGSDLWVAEASNYLQRLQRADGGFPMNARSASNPTSTALAMEALMASGGSQSAIESASSFLAARMIGDGNYTFDLTALGGTGTYDLIVESGYIVDCSIRGHEFWGDHADDSIIAIVGVFGDRDNMTLVLRIERPRLVLPTAKQKIAITFSHNMTPDDTDWWILNAGNPHTAGQGDKIDDPKFDQTVKGAYTYLTITGLVVPAEYDFFRTSDDWLIAVVGDVSHPIKDNPGWGYLVGYWSPWMQVFDFSNILAWRAWSPYINRACLDLDYDMEFDDRRLADNDTVRANGRDWVLSIWQNETALNLSFWQPQLNYTRWYFPLKYDLSTIPPSASGLYHFGVISTLNKPSFSKDYKIILRDSTEAGVYDEAYIWNGSGWNGFPVGSIWNEAGNLWVVGIEEDFLTLTRSNPVVISGMSGHNLTSAVLEGDFLKASVERYGPKEVWLRLWLAQGQGLKEVGRAAFDSSLEGSFRQVFGTWGALRETSKVYQALTLAEGWLSDEASARAAHDLADLCQQAIKFNKVYNSVVEDEFKIEAWFK